MKIVVLGGGGYIGSKLSEVLRAASHEVFETDRTLLDFDDADSYERLATVLQTESPRVVINAIGNIDSKADENPHMLFNAIFLPTYNLFKFYAKPDQKAKVDIFILASMSAGEPRRAYPFYSAMKAAEVALLRTATEVFANTTISWRGITVPRLRGGLGLQDRKAGIDVNTTDSELEVLADTIRKEISELTM